MHSDLGARSQPPGITLEHDTALQVLGLSEHVLAWAFYVLQHHDTRTTHYDILARLYMLREQVDVALAWHQQALDGHDETSEEGPDA